MRGSQMNVRNLLLALSCISSICMTLTANRCVAQENLIIGEAKWQITYQLPGKDFNIRFRGTTDGKITTIGGEKGKGKGKNLPTVIGSWSGDAKKTTLRVDGATPFRLNGTYEIALQKESNRPKWTGIFTDLSGKKTNVTIELLMD